ncbi:3-hydroxyacyl-CoA dehydrogenase [Tamaricihabitans halophyticus]|uniref:3-hydroxyacyl-CoA dehydrogenase n=1 Tax=Tamaricihabitans halophyticus TaxID=1262583 RepID=A0A4R2QUM7_9PSEU|nr:3-hydroxybutyryl-CoA dehydrogenase [Tamaricihabitans halophyticus]TCP50785.1 3-hydroxyacyl-CoA dehydrogenase [Tamaricihabitans halophyticus]
MSEIRRVGVVGAGLMGSGIAEVCARAGLDVLVNEINDETLRAGKERIEGSLARAVRSGKLSEAERDEALARIRYVTELTEFTDRQFVVEAVAEDEEIKTQVFTALDKAVEDPDAIIASNTSSIPIMKLAMATSRPGNVIGVHFFNPVPVLKLVELIPSLLSSEQTQQRAEAFASDTLGKTVVRSQDRAGFVVNALLIPYLLSAIRMLESGFASAEDIDNGMVLGCAHPMGPLALADLIGLDTTKAVADSMYAEFKEPLYSAPPLLLRMVDAGLLGKKSGRGFHEYQR